MTMRIRRETETDREAVEGLVFRAFDLPNHDGREEAALVRALRQSREYLPALSLVAEVDGTLAGHILFTELWVGDSRLVALAPLAVDPPFQGRGVGGALIREGHRIAAEAGFPGSVVLGHAAYYPRFGYRPASRFGIRAPFETDDAHFLAAELIEGGLRGVEGTARYAPEFGIDD